MDLEKLRLEGRRYLSESEVKSLLKENGIKTTRFVLLNENELETVKLDFPVAVKISSPETLHKTDVGGVILNVRNQEELKKSYSALKSQFPGTSILVEPMEKPGAEVIVGLIKDRTFGLSIMFGMGGILTELYHDVAFRLVPITKEDAEEMIDDIRASRIFYGFRGMKVSREAIVDLLVKISAFGDKYQADINQLDLNPVFVREDDAVVIDAKMILEPC